MRQIKNRFTLLAGGCALLASLLLGAAFFIYVPITQDGAWYSYPAYAWSQGGDPSENIPATALPAPLPDRVIARFGWENRSNLTVLLTKGWLSAFPHTWVSLKVFGGLQMLALAALVCCAVMWLTQDRMLSLFAGCLILSDDQILAEAFGDARPDLFIAVFAVALLILILKVLRGRHDAALVVGVVLAVTLPLLHVTAANAIAFLLAFLMLYAAANRHRLESRRIIGLAVLFGSLLVAAFLQKQRLLDVLIPTSFPASVEIPYRHDIVQELRGIVDGGLSGKIKMELTRWRYYFFISNSGQFIAVVAGLAAAAAVVRRRTVAALATLELCLVAAFVAAAGAIFLFDSHRMVQHALVVAALGYGACVAMLGVAQRNGMISASQTAGFCAGVLALVAALDFGHAVRIRDNYLQAGISNTAEEAALRRAIPDADGVRIIGPTEIWPFLSELGRPLVLIDDDRSLVRRGGIHRLDGDPAYAGASYLVVNKEYYSTWDWAGAIAIWHRQGELVKISELGDCDRTVECLAIYAFTATANSQRGPAP